MSTPAIQGQVVAVNGVVKAIDAQGHERILKAGDIIQPGEHVVLLDGATLSVGRADGAVLNVDGPREMALTDETLQPQTTDKSEAAVAKLAPEAQQVLAALENGQDPLAQLDPAAAGLNGAGTGDEGSHGFVRLMRVSETLNGPLPDTAGAAVLGTQSVQADTTPNAAAPISLTIDNISATNDSTPTIHGTGIPGLTVVVTNAAGAVVGSTVVGSDGNWYVTPTTPLPDGTDTLIATSTNTAGATANATATAIIDTTPPAVPTVAISEHGTPDGVINAAELVNGKVEATVKLDAADLAKNGSATITVNDGGHVTTLVVHADGSVTGADTAVTASYSNGTVTLDIAKPADGSTVTVTATQTDAVGNTSGQGMDDATLHSTLPTATITVDNVTADNILNLNEYYGDVVTITGTVGGDAKLGDKVTLTIGGATYTTEVIEINGHLGFSRNVGTGDLSSATSIHATVGVSDSYNNTATVSTDHDYLVDLSTPKASITVDPLTADNVLNIQEGSGNTVTVTGTVGSNVKVGDTVTLTVHGHDTSGQVIDLGNGKLGYSIPVSSDDLKNDSNIHASVTTSSIGGNTADASADHSYGVDLQAPTVSIDSGLAGDDIVNAVEHKLALTISGSTSAEDGQTVDVVLNGQHYSATVSNGSWSTEVPAADVAKLADATSYTITADVHDVAGNPAAQASHELAVDITASITISNDGSGSDGVFNKSEAAGAVVSGSTTGVEEGQTVTVTFTDSQSHVVSVDTTVGKDGSWSVPSSSLSGLVDGAVTVKAQVSDVAGNTASDSHADKLDTLATITITNDSSGSDQTYNLVESGNVVVSGTTTGVEEGRTVYITFTDGANAEMAAVTVQKDGSWTTAGVKVELGSLNQGSISVSASVVDKAGNLAETSHDDKLDTIAPTIVINTVAGDDIINAKEYALPLTISGTTSAEDGQLVDVVLDGKHYSATVSNGSWSTEVPATAVSKLTDGQSYTITADVSDKAGNPATEAKHSLAVDITAPDAPQVSFVSSGTYSYSNYFGIDDAHISTPVNGQSALATVLGDLVNLNPTATFIAQSLNFGTSTGAWQDGSLAVNSNLGTTGALADFISNSNGSTGTGLQLGSSYGTTSRAIVETGGVFTATAGNYTIAVRADDGYMLLIDGKVVAQETNNQSPATAGYNIHLDSAANNQHTIQVVYWDQGGLATLQVSLEQNGNNIVNLLQPGSSVTAQVTLNANDQAVLVDGGSVHLTGSGNTDLTLHLDASGKLVDASNNSYSYQGGVISLSMAAPAAGAAIALTATVSDKGGNTSPSAEASYTQPGIPTGHLQHDAANDTGSNAADSITADKTPVLTGTADANSQITVSLNGHSYTTTADASGKWSVSVTDSLGDGVYIPLVKAVDANGATATGFGTAFAVDTQAIITIANDGSGSDGVFNKSESMVAVVSGSTTGVEAGQTVTVSFTDSASHVVTVSSTVAANGSWSIPASSLSTLVDGAVTVKAQVSDLAGNVATAENKDKLDATAPTLTIGKIAGDDVINALEHKQVLTISGSTSAENGQTVDVVLNGQHYSATVSNGSWSTSVPAGDVAKLTDAKSYTVIADVSDKAGNPAVEASHVLKVDTTATIIITDDGSGGDQYFNKSEYGAVTVSGTTHGVEAGQIVYVTFTDGANSETSAVIVKADGSWNTADVKLDLSNLNQGQITISASVIDKAGNAASDSGFDTLDTIAPTAAGMSAATSAATISNLFNTGVNNGGNALSAGKTDGHYTLVSAPDKANLTSATVVGQSDASGKNWVTDDYSKSQWIGDMDDKNGSYSYQTTFNISSTAVLASVLLSFDLSADDNVHIWLNGKDTGLSYSSLWTTVQHVDLSGASGLFVSGNNTLTFVVDNSGGGATGLKVDNITGTAQGSNLEVDVSLAGTGAVAGDTLTFTALEGGVSTSSSHLITSSDIAHGVISEAQHLPTGSGVSTYTSTLTDKAGNVSTLATETVFGSGNHSVSDGVGVDTFKWTLASNGSSSTVASTTISNFDLADHNNAGGSALDLKDLLQGENHASSTGNLTSYLHFTQSGADTIVHVDASGGFKTGAGAGSDTVDIVLKGVSLADLGGGIANTSDTQIIQNLLNHGKLITD
ncbi:retention module-containing protein [Aquitalea denitrificans]|uniref:retention module-containing protein n=1 Tax=Aquitalea denitrificans TaxID=519081 RepID=UPI00135AAF6E|nr:retention module-containing protein [Aquitalea denitrificans]